ncbi:uncharacterized protein [Centruroides vittatus]|uniref:uncharacterized protein n=1 Tax=Centruroides vittatus TaxID=120091 RepID=UPI003510CEB5
MESENNKNEEILKLKNENDKLQIRLEDMEQNNKAEIRKLQDENYNLRTEIEKIYENKDQEVENKENIQFSSQNSPFSYGGIFQTPRASPNITHCTVKRTPLLDLTGKSNQNMKCYSKAAVNAQNSKKSRMCLVEMSKKINSDTDILDYKPQQRKFFKTSRCLKKSQKKDGLLWFDLDESYLKSKGCK